MSINAALMERRPVRIGELTVSFSAGRASIAGPVTGSAPMVVEATPAAIREHARTDDHGRYRPLPGARTLPANWLATCEVRDLKPLIEAVYPLALTHAAQADRNALRIVSLDDVLARQSGRYEVAATLSARGRDLARETLCGDCVKAPVWAGQPDEGTAIPCPEPCSVLVSLCREAALWEQQPPPAAKPDQTVAFAAFDQPGNQHREAYLAALAQE